MDIQPVTQSSLARSVIAVPPLARDERGRVCRESNRRIVQYLEQGGVSTLLYGGNAVFYHLAPSEYESTLQMLVEIAGSASLVIPSLGPSFGVMMDQTDQVRDRLDLLFPEDCKGAQQLRQLRRPTNV